MPIRVKSRPMASEQPPSPRWEQRSADVKLPDIAHDDEFRDVVKKLSIFIVDVIDVPSTFEQLRTTTAGDDLRLLVEHLNSHVTNPATVNALLALRWHYSASSDERGISDARANACEIVAWRFLTRLSEREVVEFCLYEIPGPYTAGHSSRSSSVADGGESNEHTALLGPGPGRPHSGGSRGSRPEHPRMGSARRDFLVQSVTNLTMSEHGSDTDEDEPEYDPTAPFVHLNALEIAAIADAKRFLSQHVVQKIITGIWNGEIIFWERLTVDSTKKPRFYNPQKADPFARLRVPKYLKIYESLFFLSFLILYYIVLIRQDRYAVQPSEILLYIWFAAFFYDELSEYLDAGSVFYAADVWNLFDIVMIAIGFVFGIMRFAGLYMEDYKLVDSAFDVLSLEALFMVPRVCSILSLSPYWGTLIPCFKEMGKDFLKFMVLVIILYVGFLTTFSLVGRDSFSFEHMAMIVTKIFFGSSTVGFDIMDQIDPIFGPPLMFIFVTLSSILLMGSLTGMLSNSFSRVITHAREEYLYVYSVFVLEASTSNRATHFYPPFNLLSLGIFRPLRLFLPSDSRFRGARIVLLKFTHAPIVAAIQAYEWLSFRLGKSDGFDQFRGPRTDSIKKRIAPPPTRPNSGHRPRLGPPQQTATSIINNTSPRTQAPPNLETPAEADPVSMEERVSELSAKIDKLTVLVSSLQAGEMIGSIRT